MNIGHKIIERIGVLVLAALLAAGCASTELAEPKGYYKVGTPYQIKGVWYYPKEDPEYDETGVASWYGEDFHGKLTANGERYDMRRLTAAHRTLPMPTMVRVTNLENGKQLALRVNDRGPFAHGRIIDVSARAAELLGFRHDGVAKVRVQFAGPADGRTPVAKQDIRSAPVAAVSMGTLAPVGAGSAPSTETRIALAGGGLPEMRVAQIEPDGQVTQVAVTGGTRLWVQAGAFLSRDNANRMAGQLSPAGGASVSETRNFGRPLYRVRLGPMASVDVADATLEKVLALGYNGARVIVD